MLSVRSCRIIRLPINNATTTSRPCDGKRFLSTNAYPLDVCRSHGQVILRQWTQKPIRLADAKSSRASRFLRSTNHNFKVRAHQYSSCYSTAPSTIFVSNFYHATLTLPEPSIYCPNQRTTVLASSADVPQHSSLIKTIIRNVKSWIKTLYDTLRVTLRGTEIALRFSPLLLLTPAAMLAFRLLPSPAPPPDSSHPHPKLPMSESDRKKKKKKNLFSRVAWSYTTYTLQSLGPAFVKLAQWAATRRDIFPPFVCDELSRLHDAAFAHSWSHTHSVLCDTFGQDYANTLKIGRKDVIGSGSAAQVYRGTLHQSPSSQEKETTQVAIKVLHPRIQKRVNRDLKLMERGASLIEALFPFEGIQMLSLPRAVDNFGIILRAQVDLNIEGKNLERFHDNFVRGSRGIGWGNVTTKPVPPKVSFPRPIEGWVGTNVLVEESVEDATPIARYLEDSSEEGLKVRRELAGPLLRSFLKMIFMDNFIHCDLHPGNVMVRKTIVPAGTNTTSWIGALFWNLFETEDPAGGAGAGEETNKNDKGADEIKYTIIFLDAGLTTSLGPNDQKNLKDLFKAVIFNDGEHAGRLMVERARFESCSQTEGGVETFAKGVGEIVAEFHDRRKQGLTLGAVRIGSLLSRVLDLCRMHGVEIDPAMASVVVSTLVLEGLGRSLEPNLNLIDCAMPFVLGRGKV